MTDKPHNIDRVLTVRIKIKDPEAAMAFWDALRPIPNAPLVAGCEVGAMGDGDLFDERDFLQAYIEYISEYHDSVSHSETYSEFVEELGLDEEYYPIEQKEFRAVYDLEQQRYREFLKKKRDEKKKETTG